MADEKKYYITNPTKIAYQFDESHRLGKKGTISVTEDELAELKKNFMFKGLFERKVIVVSETRPKSLENAGSQIVAQQHEIARLKKELAAANKKLAEIAATSEGDATETVIDTSEATTKKKSRKKTATVATETEEEAATESVEAEAAVESEKEAAE